MGNQLDCGLRAQRLVGEARRHDPLYLDLSAMLILGAIMALLLALVGSLLASWLSVRARLTNFAVLRALGTAPRQLAAILTCEQGIVYAGALLVRVAACPSLGQTLRLNED